jgi:hypothetical protein
MEQSSDGKLNPAASKALDSNARDGIFQDEDNT